MEPQKSTPDPRNRSGCNRGWGFAVQPQNGCPAILLTIVFGVSSNLWAANKMLTTPPGVKPVEFRDPVESISKSLVRTKKTVEVITDFPANFFPI